MESNVILLDFSSSIDVGVVFLERFLGAPYSKRDVSLTTRTSCLPYGLNASIIYVMVPNKVV